MISTLLYVLILCLVVWFVFFVLGQIPMPYPVRVVITCVVAVVLLLWLLNHLGVRV